MSPRPPSCARVARWGRAALALLVVTAPAVASAQPTGEQRAQATALFQEARARMAAGDYAGACPMLAESQRLDAGLGTLLNLATCHIGEGRTATAWAELHEVLALAERAGQADRVLFAQQRIDELAPRLSTLVIEVTPPAEGVEVTLDGAAVGRATWATAVPVDPGTHVVRASAPGRIAWEEKVVVGDPAARARVVIPPLAAEPVAPPAPAPSVPSPAPAPPLSSPAPTRAPPPDAGSGEVSPTAVLGWALTGAGVVGIGIGVGAGLSAFDTDDASDALCGRNECTTEGYTLNQDAGAAADLSTISFVVGGAALAVGVALLVEGLVRDRSVQARRDGVALAF